MTSVSQLLRKADIFQQGRAWLAVPVATGKKFGDDRAGRLAALIAYYAFGSIFPLLLVLVSILNLVLRNNASLRTHLLDSALSQYPVIGEELKSSVQGGLTQTGLALVIGVIMTFYGASRIALAIQNAMNTVWGVPQFRRPGFPRSLLRSFALIVVIGPGQIATIALSSVAGGTGHLSAAGARIAAVAVSLLLNAGLFWLGFRIATAAEVATRDLRLGAIIAAVGWQLLELFGGYFVGHQLETHSAYGVFAVVLGLLAWFYVQAQMTLFAVEFDAVRIRKLWPQTIAPPPFTDADLRSYQMYAESGQRRPELRIEVRQGTAGESGNQEPGPQAKARPGER